MKPLDHPPEVEEGDDSVNAPDDLDAVTDEDVEDTAELDDEDDYDG